MTDIFLGMPPANIAAWISAHVEPTPVGDPYTYFKARSGSSLGGGTFKARLTTIDDTVTTITVTNEDGSSMYELAKSDIAEVWGNEGCELTSFGADAFNGCQYLESVHVPSSVRAIDGNAFYGCLSLSSVVFEEGVQSIFDGAFAGCESLENITFPASLTSFGTPIFYQCDKLGSVTLLAEDASFDGGLGYDPDPVIVFVKNDAMKQKLKGQGVARVYLIEGEPTVETATGTSLWVSRDQQGHCDLLTTRNDGPPCEAWGPANEDRSVAIFGDQNWLYPLNLDRDLTNMTDMRYHGGYSHDFSHSPVTIGGVTWWWSLYS